MKLRLPLLCSILLSAPCIWAQKKPKNNKKVILFVCEHGAARSTIAAAYFNKIAKEQGLNYQAIFRGTNSQDTLTPATKAGLIRDNFDVTDMKPTLVSEKDIHDAAKIITFDCMLPGRDSTKASMQWNGIPPISKDYNTARDEIVNKVVQLIATLPKSKKGHAVRPDRQEVPVP
jgi:protein-tyrosine-phosphatase